jgi:hypothetical protein
MERTYVKKTQIEHVIERTDNYFFKTENITKNMFVLS